MDTSSETKTRGSVTAPDGASAKLLIAAPFYKNEQLVATFVQSLSKCAAEIRELEARVLLFDDSPDYPALRIALDKAAIGVGSAFPIDVRHNASNIGWLKTCNLAMQEADREGADLLLFNSDTIVFPGAIREMVRIAQLDPMIGFVNPRSNNATLATLPTNRPPLASPSDAHAEYTVASRSLPDLTYVPTAVGFAVLIRHTILAEFGYFDEIYGGGYNEENDLVMRASRCGYRAVLANRAFIWHQGEASLGASDSSKRLKEEPNKKILLKRYPEYPRLVNSWFTGDEHISERLVSALLPGPDGRQTVAFDFSSFGNFHSGTHKAGLQLLRHASAWTRAFNVVVLCSKVAYDFHRMGATGIRRAEPDGPECYAAIFRVGQPFDWPSMQRMATKGAVIGTFMLDTIALDCSHLYSASVFNLWQHTINHSDFIAYNSDFTARQFETRFANVHRRTTVIAMHSMDLADYAPATGEPSNLIRDIPEGYILVAGNQYPHKAVGDAANRIARAYPDKHVVALGVTKASPEAQGTPPGALSPVGPQNAQLLDLPNLRGFSVGGLSDEDVTALQRKAQVVVMPSHYEGFGMPILNALALQKPILARRIPPAQEIHRNLAYDPNLHFFDTTGELVELLRSPPTWKERAEIEMLKTDGDRQASDILGIIERCLPAANYGQILDRVRATQTVLRQSGETATEVPKDNAGSAAYRIGRATERMLKPMLKVPIVYKGFRAAYRIARIRSATTKR